MEGALAAPWEGVSVPGGGCSCHCHVHATLQFSLVLAGGAQALLPREGKGQHPRPHCASCLRLDLWPGHRMTGSHHPSFLLAQPNFCQDILASGQPHVHM